MAAPYKEARPCSDPVAPPRDILAPEGFPPETTRTEVMMGVDVGLPVVVGQHGGCLPQLRTFESEASPLEVGSSIPPVADRCCTAVVVVVVVAIVLCWSRLYHRCTGCHRGTSAGA